MVPIRGMWFFKIIEEVFSFLRKLIGVQYKLPNLYNRLYSRCVRFSKSWIQADVIVVAFIPLCSRANNEKLEYAGHCFHLQSHTWLHH